MGRKLIDLTNQRFGRLVVIKLSEKQDSSKNAHWFCDCECGTKNIIIRGISLRRGISKSCGCYSSEQLVKNNTKHNMYYSPEYSIWNAMKQRCSNPNHVHYKRYGGRGICICDKWNESFYEDMGPRPDPKMSIDRIDNDGNYEPSNCRWTTITEQNRNQTSNVIKNLDQANEIRTKYSSGNYTQKELGKFYNCSQPTINMIIQNKIWI